MASSGPACPCGSGKPMEECCLKGKNFLSMEGLQREIEKIVARGSQRGIDDFCGLSPDQMHAFLYTPFDAKPVASFADKLPGLSDKTPVLFLLEALAEALGEKGLKPTATGNLPRNLCRQIALAFWGEEVYKENTRYGDIKGENDFRDLNNVRVIAEQAGVVRKYKGKFILTKKGKGLLGKEDRSALYLEMLRTGIKKFNWAYNWGIDEIPIVQQSFLFSFYLLSRFGEEFRPTEFYAEAFLKAFPMAADEMPDTEFYSPEKMAAACYSAQTLHGFMALFGLAEVTEGDYRTKEEPKAKKTPLLNELVTFKI